MTPKTFMAGKKIIEIIGPPGAGKSTLYHLVCQKWRPQYNWIHQDAILAPKKPGILQLAQWLQYNAHALLGKRLVKHIPVDMGLRFIENHQDFASFCWSHLSSSVTTNGQDLAKRFRAAHFLFADFRRYQAIYESPCTKPCLIDEGFLQKSFLLQDNKEKMQALTEQYLSLQPMPYGIIHIDTSDRQVISQRLRTRKKVLPRHLAENEEALRAETKKWQNLLDMILSRVEKESVLVYHLDATKPIAENAELINQFLTRLGKIN